MVFFFFFFFLKGKPPPPPPPPPVSLWNGPLSFSRTALYRTTLSLKQPLPPLFLTIFFTEEDDYDPDVKYAEEIVKGKARKIIKAATVERLVDALALVHFSSSSFCSSCSCSSPLFFLFSFPLPLFLSRILSQEADANFRNSFLMTYRAFLAPEELLEKLLWRFLSLGLSNFEHFHFLTLLFPLPLPLPLPLPFPLLFSQISTSDAQHGYRGHKTESESSGCVEGLDRTIFL